MLYDHFERIGAQPVVSDEITNRSGLRNWRCSLSTYFMLLTLNVSVYECVRLQDMPMQEELKAVSKCKNEILVTALEYPLFFGVIAGMCVIPPTSPDMRLQHCSSIRVWPWIWETLGGVCMHQALRLSRSQSNQVNAYWHGYRISATLPTLTVFKNLQILWMVVSGMVLCSLSSFISYFHGRVLRFIEGRMHWLAILSSVLCNVECNYLMPSYHKVSLACKYLRCVRVSPVGI